MKVHKLNCNYFDHVYLVKGTFEQLNNYIKKRFDPKYTDSYSIGRTLKCEENGVRMIFIWVEEELKVAKKLQVVYHEVGHVLLYIFDIINTTVNDESSEIFLLSQEELVEQIIKKEK